MTSKQPEDLKFVVDQFILDNVQTSEGDVSMNDMYTRFKDWHRSNFPGKPCPTLPSIRSQLKTKFTLNDNRWLGVTLTSL